MSLAPGTRIGPYEIVSMVGAGGMGEVYRARDTSLKRDVALKTLPDTFARDRDRVARFRREAQVLASLNHPNIGAIYGLEQAGEVTALVLELVDGSTLADRIAEGPISLDEAMPIARQIAEALIGAHEQGIIHRDLKPANIKLRDDGTIKVLDFGLAKAIDQAGVSAIDSPAAANSPTLSLAATQAGVILGTAAYMAPEQAKGRPADKRSDVWAFGCVLYEMLSGQMAFGGDDVGDVVAAVIGAEPNWNALPPSVPVSIRQLLQRCLVKDRKTRISDAGVLRYVLDEPTSTTTGTAAAPAQAAAFRWRRIGAIIATVAVFMSVGGTSPGNFDRRRLAMSCATPFHCALERSSPEPSVTSWRSRQTAGTSRSWPTMSCTSGRSIPSMRLRSPRREGLEMRPVGIPFFAR
jgi:eukaryotic-like serine/threonine-protein kinase